jgi:hypothetical protein
MTQWWVVPSLSGAIYNGVNRTLSLEPSALPDESGVTRLPVFLGGSACTMSFFSHLDGSGTGFELRLVHGSAVSLTMLCATPPEGTRVCATAPVELSKAGDSVSWA